MDNAKLQAAIQALRPQGPASVTALTNSGALMSLKQPSQSVIENGVNALDLVGSPKVSPATFTKAVAVLQSNYGTAYAPEKSAMLFDMIRDEGWTEYRFSETLKWFLKNKPFAAWTISDWFGYSEKLYPHAWLVKQMTSGVSMKEVDVYLVGGVFLFRLRDGKSLPFPKVPWVPGRMEWCEGCDAFYDAERYEPCKGDDYHAPRMRFIYPMPVGVNPESASKQINQH